MNPLKTKPTTFFKISGMTCGHCISVVSKAIQSIPGVVSCEVELLGSAKVEWQMSPVSDQLAQLQSAFKEAGYSAELVEEEPVQAIDSTDNQALPEIHPVSTVPDTKPSLPKLPMIADSESVTAYPSLKLLKPDDPAPIEPENSSSPEVGNELESWELSVTGMHCASCVGRVEKALESSPGVQEAIVNLATERASILVDPKKAALDQIRLNVVNAGYDIVKKDSSLSAADQADSMRRERKDRVRGWSRRLIAGCIFGLPLLVLAYGSHNASHMQPMMKWAMVGLSAITTCVVGLPYFKSTWVLLKLQSSNMDTLVSLGSLLAFGYGSWMTLVPEHAQAHFLADGVIILIMITFGKWLEARSKGSAADSLEGLMDLAPRRVTAIRASGREIEIDQEELKVGMMFRVKPGEAIATDGEVVEGSANVDESMLTGESLPTLKSANAKVIGGTRNLDGTLIIRATKVGTETILQNIINAVKRAQSTKASVQALVDKVAAVFVPVVIVLAIGTLLIWGLALSRWSEGVLASAAVLLISCPCALGLATPLAVAVASTRAARSGLIIRDAGVFERCDKLTYCMFDKTGTLTEGKPEVVEVWTVPGIEPQKCLLVAGALESLSEHPLARAIVKAANEEARNINVSDFYNDRGHGVSGKVDGLLIQVGSMNWLIRNSIQVTADSQKVLEDWSEKPRSIAGVASNGKLVGLIAMEDTIRPDAEDAVSRLLKMKLTVGIISGDRKSAVQALARKLNIAPDHIYAECTPEQKSHVLDRLRASGNRVAMVGDGLNDAPALASADVSMAMASGTDVAKNAADIVIVGSELDSVAEAIALSHATLTTIRHNLIWAFSYNILAIPLAAFGIFQTNGPLIASVAMAGSSITVVLRSAWLGRMHWKS